MSVTAVFVVLLVLMGIVNIMNFYQTTAEYDSVLEMLSAGGGKFLDFGAAQSDTGQDTGASPSDTTSQSDPASQSDSTAQSDSGTPSDNSTQSDSTAQSDNAAQSDTASQSDPASQSDNSARSDSGTPSDTGAQSGDASQSSTTSEPPAKPDATDNGKHDKNDFITEETPFETRFFTVTLSTDGSEVIATDTGKIAAISTSEAETMAEDAFASGKEKGYDGNYRFTKTETDDGLMFIFVDATRGINSAKSFLGTSMLVALAGFAAISVAIILLSPKMIQPIAESYEKQKRFITNASHDLKTPLAVIKSCSEVIEMDTGENKWTDSISSQVDKMSALIGQMVDLSRMDEAGEDLAMEEVDFSRLTIDAIEPFRLVAEQRGLNISTTIEPDVKIKGNKNALNGLVGILADNATKYASGGTIRFSLSKRGRRAVLTETNKAEGLTPGKQEKLFERFYRGDTSRGGEIKGSGIGLSMAESIVEAHGGRIEATSPDGKSLTITVTI